MGIHHQGNEKEIGVPNAYIKLMRASESLNARVRRHLANYGISSSQFAVMEILHHLGPQCQRDLGTKMLKTGGNVVMIIDNLEKRGLVKRGREGKDRRYINIRLTQKGEKLIKEIFPKHVDGIAKEMSILKKRAGRIGPVMPQIRIADGRRLRPRFLRRSQPHDMLHANIGKSSINLEKSYQLKGINHE